MMARSRSIPGARAAALIAVAGLVACTPASRYSVTMAPTAPTTSFRTISVGSVGVGVTTDTLDATAPAVVRDAIAEQMRDSDRFEQVSLDGAQDAALLIDCEIVEFVRGNQASRWLLGRFGSKARLDAHCRFVDAPARRLVAEGTFTGEVQGGWFGGSANIDNMSKDLAKAVRKFLEKGR